MDTAMRDGFGVEGEWEMAWRHVVRWAECDMHGHVNHAAYLIMFEDMRVAQWLSFGLGFGAGAPGPVVAKLEVRYLKALRFQDEVLLTLRTPGCRNTSYTHDYAVWRGGLCFEAEALLVCVTDGAPTPIPAQARAGMIRG